MTQRVILGKLCDVRWLGSIVYWIFEPGRVWTVAGTFECSFKYVPNNLEQHTK